MAKLLANICFAVFYVVFYDFIFCNYLVEYWGYWGIKYNQMDLFEYLFYLFISTFPIIFYKGYVSLASVLSIFIYIFVYIPFIDTLFVGGYEEIRDPYLIVFLISMCLFFLTDKIYLFKNIFKKNLSFKMPFRVLEIFAIVLLLCLLVVHINHIRFVNILSESDLLYELRVENGNVSGIFVYILCWLKYSILPILLVSYLSSCNMSKFIMSFICFIVVFMIDMQKVTFVMPFLLSITYYFFKHKYVFVKRNLFKILIATIIAVSLFCYINLDNKVVFGIAAIFIMRTQCVSGWLMQLYLDFFEIKGNLYTYFSHISFVNMFTNSYPYSEPLGRVVAEGAQNANATFWLTDGVSGAGVFGCVLVSIVMILVKSSLNSVGYKYNYVFCTIAFLNSISSMMNVSIFTSLITGGILLSFFILACVDISPLKKI